MKTPVEYDLEKYEHELEMLLMLLNGGGESCGSGIFIRELGKLREVTREEFNLIKDEKNGNQDV